MMTTLLPPIIVSQKMVAYKPPTPHDTQVIARINECIDQTYAGILANRGGDKIATVSMVLEKAQCKCMNERKGPLDLVGRDAEYYLKLRWRVAEHPGDFAKLFQAAWDSFANSAYNILKLAMICAGLEKYMRTDPDIMVTSPGGVIWGAKGARDGLSDQPTRLGKPDRVTMPAPPSQYVHIEMT